MSLFFLHPRLPVGKPFCSASFIFPSVFFHTSVPKHASRRVAVARTTRKDNLTKRVGKARLQQDMKADSILGHRPGDEAKWLNCDLNKILVKREEIHSQEKKYDMNTQGEVELPKNFQWGLNGDPEAQHLLFDLLPRVAAKRQILDVNATNPYKESIHRDLVKAEWEELPSVHLLARLVDLRNANAPGIAFENRRRCVEAFSPADKPNDTGRPEVQAALLTMKIRNLHQHLQRCNKDIANRRSLRHLVHTRAKILKYLKRLDRERFVIALERLGMEESAIDGELIVY